MSFAVPAPVLSPEILRALRELGVTPQPELLATAWRAALAVSRLRGLSSYERVGVRSFCVALLSGDIERASSLAQWVTDPDGAMDRAMNALGAAA